MQVKYGADFATGVGVGAGEECEQFFGYLYRWAPSTKHMSSVGQPLAVFSACSLVDRLLAPVTVQQSVTNLLFN